MQPETKQCQNCKQNFTIDTEDFVFYEKIKIPPPTFCQECRTIRRLAFRNEHALYHRQCQAPGHNEKVVSMFAPDKKVVTYDLKYWWSDQWDPMDYGRDYDFSKPFFEQWREFCEVVPFQNVSNSNAVNSDFCNVNDSAKDCYMISGAFHNERVLYSNRITFNKDSLDLYVAHRSELCYEDIFCSDSYRLLWSVHSNNCSNSYFLFNCRNCQDCFGCTNLRSKSYHIFNEPYSREDYLKKLESLNLGSYAAIQVFKTQFEDLKEKAFHKFASLVRSVNCTGDNLENAKNAKQCFDLSDAIEDTKYCHWGVQFKDSFDCGPGVGGGGELLYEVFDTGVESARIFFTNVVYGSQDVYYSFYCHGSSNLFGCIGLRNKHYCIFNKQYSKEEYETLLPKIIEQMNSMPYIDKRGIEYRFGEFFPAEVSQFDYNETVAQDYYPLTKETAAEKGFRWRNPEAKGYNITIKAADLPDNIANVPDSILQETIGCEHAGACSDRCTTAFRITPQELAFYRQLNVPLPRLCFGCRHAARLAKRNPLKLWHRKCMNPGCNNEFETSYAPERTEMVLCESCYNAEVV